MLLLLAALLWAGPSANRGGDGSSREAAEHRIESSASRIVRKQLGPAKASGVLLDWNTGKLLAAEGEERQVTPGSTLKPLLLDYALKHGIVAANTRVYCRRTLRVAGHSLACTHPDDQPLLDAEEALAASCNTWFASLARRMSAEDVEAVLRQAGLPHTDSHLEDADTRILTALGLENVSATPMQLARAYRSLLRREEGSGNARSSPVWKGLHDSVAYGMANHARVQDAGALDVEVLGKTGTASNAGEWWTHGWFAGGVAGRFVLVVYLPHGDGGAAAGLAGGIMRQLSQAGAR